MDSTNATTREKAAKVLSEYRKMRGHRSEQDINDAELHFFELLDMASISKQQRGLLVFRVATLLMDVEDHYMERGMREGYSLAMKAVRKEQTTNRQ